MQIKIAIIGAGMNAVVKALAEPFSVNLGCRITCLQRSQQQWLLHDEHEQQHGPFDWVISTLPAPQALELLPTTLSFYPALKKVEMDPCFTMKLGCPKRL